MNDKQQTNNNYGKAVEQTNKYTSDNMGDRQVSMLKTILDHTRRCNTVPSKRYLCAYEDVGNASGYESINNLRKRGLVTVNSDSGSPQGSGSLELTKSGYVYLMAYGDNQDIRDYCMEVIRRQEVEVDEVEQWLVNDIGESVHNILLMLLRDEKE